MLLSDFAIITLSTLIFCVRSRFWSALTRFKVRSVGAFMCVRLPAALQFGISPFYEWTQCQGNATLLDIGSNFESNTFSFQPLCVFQNTLNAFLRYPQIQLFLSILNVFGLFITRHISPVPTGCPRKIDTVRNLSARATCWNVPKNYN